MELLKFSGVRSFDIVSGELLELKKKYIAFLQSTGQSLNYGMKLL